MSSQPKVTIYILSYNHAEFLPAAIESALDQTYENIEIIIVDDGSADESLSIAQAYAARHPDVVQVFTHPDHANRGISATVNLCVEKASGTYLQGLASDDLLHPHKIAEQVDFLERHPELGWVYGYAVYVDDRNRPLPERGLFGVDVSRAADPVEELILGNAICGLTPLIRRAALAQVQLHDQTLVYGDWDFWVRLASRQKMGFLPRARARYRVHDHNTSVGIPTRTGFGHCLQVMDKLPRQSSSLGGLLARPRTQALLDLQCAFYAYGLEDTEGAALHLAAAFKTYPKLQRDPRYFCRWLAHCQHVLRLQPEPPPKTGFAPWVRAQLVASVDEAFVRSVTRCIGGWKFRRSGERYDHAVGRWQFRRRLLNSLFSDARVWRERELFVMYMQSLLGSKVRRRFRRLKRPQSA
jgi:alpha-1,3-rhamnosyltransferase